LRLVTDPGSRRAAASIRIRSEPLGPAGAIVRNPANVMVILAYFAVIAVAFFLLIVRPQRKRITAHRALVAALEIGDEVVTTGGIFGTIRGLDDDQVQLEVATGVVIAVARAAIAQTSAPHTADVELPADDNSSDD
jgi:preprotein translocase subunit YajC